MFKRQHNELYYGKSVTVTETVFRILTFAGELLVKKSHIKFHENSTDGLVTDVM